MPALRAKDLQAVLDVMYAVNDDTDDGEMPNHVLTQLGRLVRCDSLSYNRIEGTTGQLLDAIVEPAELNVSELSRFNALFHQHPGFAAYCSGRLALGSSAALTDLVDLPRLRRLPLYVDMYRPRGVNDQLMCVAQAGNHQVNTLCFNRTRPGFSARDRAIVDLATLHLCQAITRRQRLSALTAAVRSLSQHSQHLNHALPRLSALTPRERQVVEQLLSGATNREIAQSLAISPRTVHKHLECIYRKLGLGNRTSLIALVHQSNDTARSTGPSSRSIGPATQASTPLGRMA
jgi:DNA-binding CsgD family transcriptional regulator